MNCRGRGRNVVHKIHHNTATKLYKSAYTYASVTSFGNYSCPSLFALTLVHSILFANFATVVKFTAVKF